MRPIVRTLAILSKIAAVANGLLLGLFTLRRLIFIYGAQRSLAVEAHNFVSLSNETQDFASVLIVVPVHNEAAMLPTLLEALEQLDFPAEQLTIGFVDDGSSDESAEILRAWITGRPQAHLLSLPDNVGKAQALNEAVARWGDSATSSSSGGTSGQAEFIAIYDADDIPQPDALHHLIQPFSDPQVAAVTGHRAVSNPLASYIASYASYENLVHQHITVAAKQRLNLAPPILGSNCVYRRSALAQVGGFTPNALLEDSDLTIRFARAGWRTVYAPAAISYHAVPTTLRGYVRQHLRWSRGFQQTALTLSPLATSLSPTGEKENKVLTILPPSPAAGEGLGVRASLELALFSTGYLDRATLLFGLFQMRQQSVLRIPIVTYLLLPFAQTIAALKLENAPRKLWLRLWVLPIFFCVDITIAVMSLVNGLLRRPQRWESRDQRR